MSIITNIALRKIAAAAASQSSSLQHEDGHSSGLQGGSQPNSYKRSPSLMPHELHENGHSGGYPRTPDTSGLRSPKRQWQLTPQLRVPIHYLLPNPRIQAYPHMSNPLYNGQHLYDYLNPLHYDSTRFRYPKSRNTDNRLNLSV